MAKGLLRNVLSMRNVLMVCAVLMGGSALFYAVSLSAMAAQSGADVWAVLESNALVSVDLIAACGKVFAALVTVDIVRQQRRDADAFVGCGLLAISQFMVQSYLPALGLLFGSYISLRDNEGTCSFVRAFRQNVPAILVVLLHLFVVIVNMRIAAIV